MTPTPEELLAEARRELEMRQRVYPKWKDQEKIHAWDADHRLACQAAIVAILEQYVEVMGGQQTLFAGAGNPWHQALRQDAGAPGA